MEPHVLHRPRKTGWIEVVCGSMFSGKTEELIRRMKRARIAKLRTEIFKPALDVRFNDEAVVSHDESSLRSTPVATASQILLLATESEVVGIDEAQFFGTDLVAGCEELAAQGKRVSVVSASVVRWMPVGKPGPQFMC